MGQTRRDALIPTQTGTDVLLQDRERQPDEGGGLGDYFPVRFFTSIHTNPTSNAITETEPYVITVCTLAFGLQIIKCIHVMEIKSMIRCIR